MVLLQGSKSITLWCNGCDQQGPVVRAFLFREDDLDYWDSKTIPEGWTLDEDPLVLDTAFGYCPTCNPWQS